MPLDVFSSVPLLLNNIVGAQCLLTQATTLNYCAGHSDPYFVAVVESRKGKLYSSNGNVAAVADRAADISILCQEYSATV